MNVLNVRYRYLYRRGNSVCVDYAGSVILCMLYEDLLALDREERTKGGSLNKTRAKKRKEDCCRYTFCRGLANAWVRPLTARTYSTSLFSTF